MPNQVSSVPARPEETDTSWVHEVCRYHKPTDEQIHKLARIRRAAEEMMNAIVDNVAECEDQETAIRYVRQAMMFANQGVTLEGLV